MTLDEWVVTGMPDDDDDVVVTAKRLEIDLTLNDDTLAQELPCRDFEIADLFLNPQLPKFVWEEDGFIIPGLSDDDAVVIERERLDAVRYVAPLDLPSQWLRHHAAAERLLLEPGRPAHVCLRTYSPFPAPPLQLIQVELTGCENTAADLGLRHVPEIVVSPGIVDFHRDGTALVGSVCGSVARC